LKKLTPVLETCILAVIAIIIGTIFTIWNLNLSLKIGRLSTITNYDDVVYLSRAADIYFKFRESGFLEGTKLLFTKSLHAPFTVWDALLGFMLVGFDLNRVYYAQLVVLLNYLFFVGCMTRKVCLIFRIAILLGSLAVPFASLCVQVFRPDQMSGVVVAGIIVAILTSRDLFDKFWKAILIGFGLGLALLVKPSTFALIMIVVPGAWLCTAVRMILFKKYEICFVCVRGGVSLAAAFLIAGWYWVQHGKELWSYFIMNSFGMNADVWRLPGGAREHLLYYFHGPVLQSSLGLFTIPLLIIFVGGALRDIFANENPEHRMKGASLLIMAFCIYGIFVLQGIKNEYMGGVFYMFILYGAIHYLSRAILWAQSTWRPRPILCYACAAMLIGVAWTLYRFPETERVNPLWASINKSTTQRVLNDLSQRITSKVTSIVFTQGGPIIQEYVTMVLQFQSKNIIVESAAFTKNLADAIGSLPRYDYIVLQDPGMEGRPGFPIPSELWARNFKQYLDSQPEWTLVSTYPSVDKKNAYLYGRSSVIK
jgi:hypothetical protein